MTSVDEAHGSRRLTKIFSISSDHLNEIRNLVALENRKVSPGISTENEGSRINVISVNTDHEINEKDELPDEWISYNFERKRSCILSNIYSTCVTKAINHLESLQLSIDKWISAFENQSLSSSSDESESSKIIINFIKRKSILKTDFTKNPDQKLRFVDQEEIKNPEGFFVHGQGIDLEKSKMVVVENEAPVQDLHAGGIMEEILMLVARLELDRKRVENLLKRERENLNVLKECIESMALKRAVELPLRVQNEHDACISDITELNWHISFNTKSERKLSRKVEIEERLHQHLQEQISTIKNNTPLIEEKIASELVIIKKIEAAQADVDQFVSKAKLKLEETQEKSQNTYKKAAKEREAIENDLANCRRELNRAKKRLQEAMNALDEYSRTIVECAKTIEENTAQEKIESAKRIELRANNENLNDENKKIQLDIYRIEKEIEKVTKQNEEKNALIEQMIAKFNADMAKITDALNKRLDKLDKILKKKKEKEIDLEEMNRDQKNMENKISKEERNRERLLEDRQRVEEELRDAGQDLEAAFKLNASTIADYEKEMRRLENKEDNLKKQITDLRKQIGEERTQLNNLINRIIAEAEDFAQNKINSEQKKIHFERKKVELEGRLSGLEIRVAETESKKNTLCEEVRVLNEKLDVTLKTHKQVEDDLSKKIEDLEPKHSKASIDYFTNKANLEYMKSHSIEMKSKMEEMEDSKKVMAKTIEKIGEEIKNLEVDYTEYQLQSDASKNLDDGFKFSLEEVKNRIENSQTSHDKRTQERSEYLNKLNLQLDNYLELNKELASRYRYIKYFAYNKRLDLMKQIEIKMSAFVNMKDKRQVISLQQRMHNALNDYFKFRIKNGEKNYFDLREERECIGDEINSLEDLLKKSTRHMARFLEKQTDFEQVRQKAIQKVIKQELIEQQQAESLRQRESKRIDTEQTNTMADFPQVGLSMRTRNPKLAPTDLVSAI